MNIKLLVLCITLTISCHTQEALLVTGGAGYIGSATVLELITQGRRVIILDKKFPESSFYGPSQKITDYNKIPRLRFSGKGTADQALFIKGDCADTQLLTALFKQFNITTVIHFAGFIEAGKSVKDPAPFYHNNVSKTISLLTTLKNHGIKQIIFSSSAAVYGIPHQLPINETHSCNPINPYGKTKYIIDMLLEDYAQAYGFKALSLRYFNAAGAIPQFDIGERHDPETHVIPLLLRAAYLGKPFYIFGDDYTTPDGSCIRDYLHIKDLATAHYKALEYLETHGTGHTVCNLGTGTGHSVKELIACAQKITGIAIKIEHAQRRPGDPDSLIADPTKAETLLGWKAQHSSLENIIKTAHEFHSS